MIKRTAIREFEIGLRFRDEQFVGIVEPGTHWSLDLMNKKRIEVCSRRDPLFTHEMLDQIVKSGELKHRAVVLDLRDWQRALVWIDGRFSTILRSGLYALWNDVRDVRVEVINAREVRFEHDDIATITRWAGANHLLDICTLDRDRAGVLFVDGRYVDTLEPGRYAFWRGTAESRVVEIDLRESSLDISGQELMTSDKVSLRMNANVTYRVIDPRKAVSTSDQCDQALYREAQLALRTVVGTREFDDFLQDKEVVAQDAEALLGKRSAELGLEVVSLGIRDIIMPGDMRELMNKVVEAKKAAEANLIARREETAAARSQANTAKLLESNPMLMRMRELEVLEKVASSSNLQVVLGENGLSDRLVKLI